MWYGNTKSLLESIVRGLRTEAPQNDAAWQAQTDLVQVCLAEMVEMSEATVNPSKGATSRYVHRPVADKLNRAMPQVRFMLTAMRDRDRTIASLTYTGTYVWVTFFKPTATVQQRESPPASNPASPPAVLAPEKSTSRPAAPNPIPPPMPSN